MILILLAFFLKDKNTQQYQKQTQNGEGPSESVETNSDQAPVTENIEKKKNKRERKEERKNKTKTKKTKKHLQEDENGLDHKPDYKMEEKKKKKSKKLNDIGEARAVEENGQDIQQQGSENSHSKVKCGKRKHAKSSTEGG